MQGGQYRDFCRNWTEGDKGTVVVGMEGCGWSCIGKHVLGRMQKTSSWRVVGQTS